MSEKEELLALLARSYSVLYKCQEFIAEAVEDSSQYNLTELIEKGFMPPLYSKIEVLLNDIEKNKEI